MFYGFASQRAVGLADDREPAHSGLVELRYTGEDTSAAGVGHWAEVYRWSSDAFLALSVATTALALALARGWRASRVVALVLLPILGLVAMVPTGLAYFHDPAPGRYGGGFSSAPSALVVRIPAAEWVPIAMIAAAAIGMVVAWAALLGEWSGSPRRLTSDEGQPKVD